MQILLNLRRSSGRPSTGTPLEVFCGQRTTLTGGGFSCGTGLSYPSLLPRAISNSPKAQSSRRWTVARRSLTMPYSSISLCQLSIFTFSKCFTKPFLNFSSCNRCVYCELVAKDALASIFVRTYLQSYVDDSSEVFIYTSEQVERFGSSFLRGIG